MDYDLSKYKVIVLPILYLLYENQIENIERFVSSGGTVIATYMTGYADETDLCYLGGFPGGKLKEIFGLTADEIDTLYETDYNSVMINNKSCNVIDYCEIVTPTTANVIGVYEKDFYKDKPAVLKNIYNKGKAYYIACRDTGELLDEIYINILKEAEIEYQELPFGVSIHTRKDDYNTYLFVENYTDSEQKIILKEKSYDIEKDEVCDNVIILDA